MSEKFQKGETYQSEFTVLKVKKDIPTVIEIDRKRYVLEHKDTWKGNKYKVAELEMTNIYPVEQSL